MTPKQFRILCEILFIVAVLGILTACGSSNSSNTNSSNANTQPVLPDVSMSIPTVDPVTTQASPTRAITVHYTITEVAKYIEDQTDQANVITVLCKLVNGDGSDTSFNSSFVLQGSGDTTQLITIANGTNGTYQVVCKMMWHNQPLGAPLTSSPITIPCAVTGFVPNGGGPLYVSYDVCSAPPQATSVSAGSDPYFIYSINASGPNIVIETASGIQVPSCNFADGGNNCPPGSANVQVLETIGGPYDTRDQAVAAYCGMVTNIRSAYGGTKGDIGGKSYWLDNAPACS